MSSVTPLLGTAKIQLPPKIKELAVLANVAYCAAYVVDVFVQMSGFREQWRAYRWMLFFIGMSFAAILARFWALGMFYPGSH